ncbi:DUF3027 family protein [Williamsia muralis]|uniref:DUF3027 family protein n=1 Tax=Williamsia marianensis TaxID=85044 RepID=A0A495K840_WILMA|nr:DUF3027 family protein [Williamsia muralis]
MNAVTEQTDAVTDHDGPGSHVDQERDDAEQKRVEALLTAAVSQARAAIDADDKEVGDHLEAVTEAAFTVTHYFAAQVPGYRGWQWCVVLAGCPGCDDVTVNEVALLPGSTALTAPEWVPWAERVRPGDLNPGDLLATPADDPRLVPGYVDNDDNDPFSEESAVATELGLGRKRLLSREGRLEAASRWVEGEHGPASEMARSARHNCGTCGFYLPVVGSLRAAFGVCANEYAADGRVVHAEYGCGAHSDVEAPTGGGSPAYDAYDDGAVEIHANS